MGSILVAALGVLAIALVVVPGQAAWNLVRGCLFGVFGILTYFVGPLLLYVAYLMASGYLVGKFLAKTLLLALVCSSVPVVFSSFTVGDSNFVQVVQTLFAWGQTRFWAGGVFGGAIGASLVALCGRPAANFVMILLFITGLMVFFAVTPKDVVQFIAYQSARLKEARAKAEAGETEYDTQLFAGGPEEEPIENLTGALPDTQPADQPHHPAFDAEPYLEQDEARLARRRAAQQPAAPRPARPGQPAVSGAAPVMPQADQRAAFDVDLGPDRADQVLHEALEHDPLEPVEIGPGGTFGLDPLKQLGRKNRQPAPRPAAPAEPEPEEDFSLHLEAAPEPEPTTSGELDDLIRRAMAGIPDEADEDSVGEIRLDVEAQRAPVQPAPQPDPMGTRDVIPTIGGSFDAAQAAWNAGVPISDVLAGRAAPPAPPRRARRTGRRGGGRHLPPAGIRRRQHSVGACPHAAAGRRRGCRSPR